MPPVTGSFNFPATAIPVVYRLNSRFHWLMGWVGIAAAAILFFLIAFFIGSCSGSGKRVAVVASVAPVAVAPASAPALPASPPVAAAPAPSPTAAAPAAPNVNVNVHVHGARAAARPAGPPPCPSPCTGERREQYEIWIQKK